MGKIAILIPCYNEAQTIAKVVKDFKKEGVVYVYDNNSTDDTVKLARKAGAIVRHEPMQGKGNVVRRMFREINAEVYVLVDGDDTYPAKPVTKMIQAIQNGADMVVGDRLSSTYYSENKRAFHNSGNNLVRLLVNKLFKTNIKDIMTGYRAFSYDFVKTFPVCSGGFEIETEMSIHAAYRRMNVQNIVVDYRDRPDGSVSKLNTFGDGFKVIKTIASLCSNYRPLLFFGSIALLLFIIGIIGLIPVLTTFAATKLVPQFPTLIVCCFILMASLLMLVTGIILNNLLKKDTRDFEITFNNVHARDIDG